ncbi:hypothetical protein E2562_034666, partial [Oryza meyeriana var. granulata]
MVRRQYRRSEAEGRRRRRPAAQGGVARKRRRRRQRAEDGETGRGLMDWGKDRGSVRHVDNDADKQGEGGGNGGAGNSGGLQGNGDGLRWLGMQRRHGLEWRSNGALGLAVRVFPR